MSHIRPYINEKILLYFHNKELDELYISVAIKTLAESLVGIFVPVYLWTLGFDFHQIVIYYMVLFAALFLAMLFGLHLNGWIGLKKTMGLGIMCFVIYFWSLFAVSNGASYLMPGLLAGIAVGIYYASFHIEFSKFSDKSKEGTQFSIFRIITTLMGVLGPFIGALFIKHISFDFVFFVAIALLVLSTIPLFMSKDISVPKLDFSWKTMRNADSKIKGLVYGIDGFLHVISGVFWPLFIFITLKEVLSLGIIVSASSLVMIIFLFVLGKLSDKHKEKVLKIGISGHSLSWISKISFLTPLGVFFSNFFSGVTSLMIEIPFNKMIYSGSKKTKNLAHYFLFRELFLTFGRFALLGILFFVDDIYWAFILAFFATFAYFLLLRKVRKAV